MSQIQTIELNVIDGEPITTSRQIAIHFNKQHRDLVRKIKALDCSPKFNARNFARVDYEDSKGEIRKEYQITRDGFMYLVMGFTGKQAAKYKEAYIEAFNEMEAKLSKPLKTATQQAYMNINDFCNADHSLEKTCIAVTHTKSGEIIKVDKIERKTDTSTSNKEPTTLHQPSWLSIVETFFNEIEHDDIPEKMRQNMLLSKETITLANGQCEKHDCLFFRASNLMAFFRKMPQFFDLMNESTIHSAPMLLGQLKIAGVLAFNGKTKEKGIPIMTSTSSDVHVKRVPHLVALDLVVLERDYGVVMSNSEQVIARTIH